MSLPTPQHYTIPNFTFTSTSTPTTIHLSYLDINPTSHKVALISTHFRSHLHTTPTYRTSALKTHRIIVVALLANSESSSPSNTPSFPTTVSYPDCVRAQHHLLTHLHIPDLDFLLGFSMAGQCAYHWLLTYPHMVKNAVIICSSARTSRHNYQFLEGPKAALVHSADYHSGAAGKPVNGLRAFGKAYSAWLTSAAWFERELYHELGYETLQEWDEDVAGRNYYTWHADDLLCLVGMWQGGDVTRVVGDGALSLEEALGRIQARVLLMACETDQYFTVGAAQREAGCIPECVFRVIR
ncbi:Alpha/Beta hydrolase protein [Aspergillus karnatakaensis]|uniref:Alpha/Beta hydrolase protein n=1 Tax=Aspergillus karnatakaensis TaxID=1810916 RepID=UPI003CCD9902